MKYIYKTPEGEYKALYADMLNQVHLLIAGATGSGKSVVINSLIYTALYHSPATVQFILIDPKRVELIDYKTLPHTLCYASEPDERIKALEYAIELMESRYREMQVQKVKKYWGSDIYVIIDELQDLMTTQKRLAAPLIQRLGQVGRAANIHVIAATQSPIAAVIPTPIKVNFDSRVGLRTGSAQDSRNILGVTGCENLPDPVEEHRAEGYYKHGCKLERYHLPMTPESEIQRLIDYWHRAKPKIKWF